MADGVAMYCGNRRIREQRGERYETGVQRSRSVMRQSVLTLVVGTLLASFAALAAFASSGDTPTDFPSATGRPAHDTDPQELSVPHDEGSFPGDFQGAVDGGNGQRDVLGVPQENTHPCVKTGGCTTTANPGAAVLPSETEALSPILHLPQQAVDGMAKAVLNREAAKAHGDAHEGQGPPDDVPRGGPNAGAEGIE